MSLLLRLDGCTSVDDSRVTAGAAASHGRHRPSRSPSRCRRSATRGRARCPAEAGDPAGASGQTRRPRAPRPVGADREAAVDAVLDQDRTTVVGTEVAVRPPRALRPLVAPAAPRPRPAPDTAADVMTRFPLTVHQGDSMWTAWGRLADSRATHVVVVDDHRRPVGVLDDRTLAVEWPAGPMAARRTPVHTLLRGRA